MIGVSLGGGEHQNLLAAKLKRFLMVLPSVLNQIQLVFAGINPGLEDKRILPISTASVIGAGGICSTTVSICVRIRAGTCSWTGAVTGTVTIAVAVTAAAATAIAVTTLATAAMTIAVASLTTVAAAISSAVTASVATTATISAATTATAAGEDEGVIDRRVQIGGEDFAGPCRVDISGC